MYFSLVESLEENLSEENLSEMGQYVSRLELDSEDEFYDASNTANSSSYGHAHDDNSKCLDNEISDLTMIKSKPNEHLSKVVPGKRKRSVSAVKMLAGREANYSGRGRFTSADCCHVASRYVPVKGPWLLDQMSSRAYVSQFSTDGSLFITGFQGSHIRIYNVDRGWKVKKNIVAKSLRWTITDTSLSPDQQYLVYSSMSPLVHIVDIGSAAIESHANVNELHDGLDFSEYGEGYGFGIFSVKFSTDGRELVAGSSDDAIYVYDLEAKKLSLRISAHISDVNTVCFADESGHLIFSGSDDNYCKVWDRRCFIARGKAAGVMMGHLEGITFIDSRGDGRYFISNGKDQCIKLWDVRKMSSNITCDPAPRNYEWDYRWMDYPQQARHLRHPNDLSVATYEGHSVLRTLIRCYFSPEFSLEIELDVCYELEQISDYIEGIKDCKERLREEEYYILPPLPLVPVKYEILASITGRRDGKKYIYTGSNDGSVYIYDLVSGAIVAKLDHHMSVVRDCNWHPSYPMLVSSSWDGSLVKWDFSGSDEMPAPPSDERDLWRRHL